MDYKELLQCDIFVVNEFLKKIRRDKPDFIIKDLDKIIKSIVILTRFLNN